MSQNKEVTNKEPTVAKKGVKKLPSHKSNKVKNEEEKEATITKPEHLELVKKMARQVSKELVTATVRKAVTSAEMLTKYPPLPENLLKLSQPTKATYVSLYKKYVNVLHPNTVNSIKGKIPEYLETIEERKTIEKLDKEKQMERRKKQKELGKKKQKEIEYKNFCFEQCDELFEIFLAKFGNSLNRDIPKPLIMGPNSINLQENIKKRMLKLLQPSEITDKTPAIVELDETMETLSFFIMEFVKNSLVEAVREETI